MLFALVPHAATTHEMVRFFSSYSSAEQAALVAAKDFERRMFDPDWCVIIAYEGIDELLPTFLYRVVGSSRLSREKWPSPSP